MYLQDYLNMAKMDIENTELIEEEENLTKQIKKLQSALVRARRKTNQIMNGCSNEYVLKQLGELYDILDRGLKKRKGY